MKGLRSTLVRRLQALQCAGVEDVSRERAMKILKAVCVPSTPTVTPPVLPKSPANIEIPAVIEQQRKRPSFVPQTSRKPSSPTTRPAPKTAKNYGGGGYYNSEYNRSNTFMAPKLQPISLDIIVPPHEDYSALTQMEDRAEALRLLDEKVRRCVRCIELVSNRTQTVLGTGNPYASLMFLGEAPGKDEDEQGIPFVGRAGKLLTDMIEKGMKINRAEETYICNILRCRPPGNRVPMPEEALKCRAFLDTQIGIVKPKFICCLGASAAQYLFDTTTTISKMRLHEYQYGDATVVCTYHPAYLLRNPAQKRATWEDLQFLMKLMGLPI